MDKTWNWGILAPGRIAHKFASDLKLVKNANLKAVGSRDLQRARLFAKEYGADIYYDSYEKLVKDPEVEVVYIASPHVFHYEHTLLCIENGKHVLCEKPMAMNKKQAQKMAGIAQDNHVFLMEAFWTRFIPSYLKARQLAVSGQLGEIKHIQADFGFKAEYNTRERLFNKNLGGGSLLDIGIYPIFMTVDILGKPDEIISSGVIGETGVDESCAFVLKYNSGSLASLSSTIVANTPIEATISGSKARVKINRMWFTPSNIDLFQDGKTKHTNFNEKGFGYKYEAAEVQKCLERGLIESPDMSHQKSIIIQEVMDTIRDQIGLNYKTDSEN